MHTDTIDPVFVFYQKGETKMLHAELTDKIISSFFKVYYENQVVGDYFADIIADQVILEIKAAEGLREENIAQLINYLKATDKEVGLLLNFGKTPEFKRVLYTNDRKERFESETPNP